MAQTKPAGTWTYADRDAFHLAVAASGDETPVSPLLGPLSTTAADLFAGVDS